MSDSPRHLSPEEFRQLGHRMIDWIAEYWSSIEAWPVLSPMKPGETAAKLPSHPPQHGLSGVEGPGSWDEIFRDLEAVILPGLTHWQHPNFYAFFPANISGPAVLGELLSAGLGVQGMLWATSPACTEVETRVLDWLGEMVGLPESFLSTSATGGGVIQGTASESTLAAIVAARRRVLRHGGEAIDPSRLVAYASNQAHSSVIKGAMVAGVASGPEDRTHVRLIDVDDEFRLRPDALEAAIREDVAAGRIPFFVCATVGTTGVTAVDPVGAMAGAISGAISGGTGGLAARPWLHVDAAHSGAACICPEFRWMLDGIAEADSFCFNPHKWLLTNFDCGCFWTRDRGSLTDAMSITPDYLRNTATESGRVIDYRDWHVPLGRRFRALKLWFVIRHYGIEGLRAYVREHVELAAGVEARIAADPAFELAAPRTVNLVCFRPRPRPGESEDAADRRTRKLMDAVNGSGRAYLTHTTIPVRSLTGGSGSRTVLRLAIGGTTTQRRHVEETWELIVRLHREMASE